MVRLTWHEAVVRKERLIIRWPTEERRLRTLIFVPLFIAMAGTALVVLSFSVPQHVKRDALLLGIGASAALFLYGCISIWFSRLWVLDKKRNALLRRGWQKIAHLDEFSRFIVKREKRGRAIVFVMLAEREDGTSENLGAMDQEDANELGREIARFTRRPFSSR